jgi:hypothetical protein
MGRERLARSALAVKNVAIAEAFRQFHRPPDTSPSVGDDAARFVSAGSPFGHLGATSLLA